MQSCKLLCGSSDNVNKDDFESTFACNINLTLLSVLARLLPSDEVLTIELHVAIEQQS